MGVRPWTIIVGIGDVAVVGAFVTVGLWYHGISVLVFPGHAVATGMPFVVGWVVAAGALGLFSPATASVAGRMGRVVVAWVLGAVLGAGIRSTPVVGGGASVEFVAVIAVVGLAFIVPWRLLASVGHRYGCRAGKLSAR